jgi:hypothetical protein
LAHIGQICNGTFCDGETQFIESLSSKLINS